MSVAVSAVYCLYGPPGPVADFSESLALCHHGLGSGLGSLDNISFELFRLHDCRGLFSQFPDE